MNKPTLPSADPPAAGPLPTMAEDQAVLAWLAVQRALPDQTCALLLNALTLWEALAPLPLVTALPSSGPECNVGELLLGIGWRLLAHPFHPGNLQTQMVLADIHRMLGLARYSLRDPDGARAGRHRWEQDFGWVVSCASRRPTSPSTSCSPTSAANAASSCLRFPLARARASTTRSLATGPGSTRSVRSGPQSHNLLCPPE